jgi:hypothetical protein
MIASATPRPPGVETADRSEGRTACADDPPNQGGGPPRQSPLAVAVPGLTRNVEVKMASERGEWEEAFRVVAQSYRARGYEASACHDFRFTPYHALPDTVTFVAKEAGQVVATLSLVADNWLLGLPLEEIYRAEVAGLRRAGRRLVEVTSLADRGLNLRDFSPIFVALMRLMAQYGLSQNADTWVITINPRHREFYRRVMGFVPFGPQRVYPSVGNHPAEAYLLDLGLAKANAPQMYQQLVGQPLPAEALTAPRMPVEVVRDLVKGSAHPDERLVDRIHAPDRCRGRLRRW